MNSAVLLNSIIKQHIGVHMVSINNGLADRKSLCVD